MAASGDPSNYVVLARKYRPATFEDLIGQEVMVRTLRNAFQMERIAQAYMLTGVRGVGKTTTARILARALNYELPGTSGKPTLDIGALGVHCQAIMESRHVDVMEMDAASNTGIDDIREIIEAVRYKPAAARYRVFIIDEVHMLSKSAFNGLLKTLEEPPPHVKFIFATTEIGKVPVTILSRCQRFDLRRVEPETLAQHFAGVVAKEGEKADPEALMLIARQAEGSVRDGLSLLDQALTLGGGHATEALVLDMLGLAGRAATLDLLSHIFNGDARSALAHLGGLYANGADPLMVLNDLAEAVHLLTRRKAAPQDAPADVTAEDSRKISALLEHLSVPRLSIAWQMLLKGIDEANTAARPLAAAEMLLIRMCYTQNLPSPADVLNSIDARPGGAGTQKKAESVSSFGQRTSPVLSSVAMQETGSQAVARTMLAPKPAPGLAQKPTFASFQEIVDHAGGARDIKTKTLLEENVELLQFGQNFIELRLLDGAPKNFATELARKLQGWTGERWVVSLSEKRGQTPLGIARREAEQRLREELRKHPAIKRVLHQFPGAEIKSVHPLDET